MDAKPDVKYTHHVADRPGVSRKSNVEYVQPQYIVDCLNNLFLLPTSQYAPGNALPAHLSPFVDNEKEGYLPNRHKEILHLKGEEVVEDESEVEEPVPAPKKASKKEKEAEKEKIVPLGKGDADMSSDSDDNDSE